MSSFVKCNMLFHIFLILLTCFIDEMCEFYLLSIPRDAVIENCKIAPEIAKIGYISSWH